MVLPGPPGGRVRRRRPDIQTPASILDRGGRLLCPYPTTQPRGNRWGSQRCVRDARPQGRDAAASMPRNRRDAWGGGPAPLATAVSLPTARAARPAAQRRDTPDQRCSKNAAERFSLRRGRRGCGRRPWRRTWPCRRAAGGRGRRRAAAHRGRGGSGPRRATP
jgi:hypothetical protein